MYKITITKMKDNPMYDSKKAEEYREFKNRGYMRYSPEYEAHTMLKEIEVPCLVVDLTDEEFKAIKKAVLEIM